MTGLDAAAQPGGPLPRGLTVVLTVTELLVSVLAQRQFASILGPVLLSVILVIGVYPMTGILRPLPGTAVAGSDRHGDRAGGRDPGPRGSVGAVRRPVVRRPMGQRDRDLGRRLADPVRFTEMIVLSAIFLAPLDPARVTPSSPAPTPNWSRTNVPLANALSRRKHDER